MNSMIEVVVFCSFIFALTLFLAPFYLNKSSMKTKKEKRGNKKILLLDHVEKGGVINLSSVGVSLDQFDVEVKSRNLFKEGSITWNQLECDSGESRIWISFDSLNPENISVNLKKIRLADLQLSVENLAHMDKEGESVIVYNSRNYIYKRGGDTLFYKDGLDENFERLAYWQFKTLDGSYSIDIEKWNSGGIDVYLSESISLSNIIIYKTSVKL